MLDDKGRVIEDGMMILFLKVHVYIMINFFAFCSLGNFLVILYTKSAQRITYIEVGRGTYHLVLEINNMVSRLLH